jgi:hypothetical protein
MENFEKNLDKRPSEVTSEDIAKAKESGERKLYQVPGSTTLLTEEEYEAWKKEQLDAGVNTPEK